MNKFQVRTEVRFGEDALDSLSEFKYENAVIVTDPFMVKSGTADIIAKKLTSCKNISVFGDVKPNPPIELVAEGLKFLQSKNADIVVALGGGSSIDAAKAVLLIAKQNMKKNVFFVAVPTTSGTGSEVTKFSVITDEQEGVKYPLVDDGLLPDIAVLDPSLVVSAPPQITADTGFDVITHAVEAYVSSAANDLSDAMCEKALNLSFEYLIRAYDDGSDLTARDKMHSASCMAGIAFSEVSLGINHSIAHALGAKFHIPHGRANAMLLPLVIEYNADLPDGFSSEYTEAAKKYAQVAKNIGLPCPNTRVGVINLIKKIKQMLIRTKTPLTLKDAGVSKELYDEMKDMIVRNALDDACTPTSPRRPSADDIRKIVEALAQYK